LRLDGATGSSARYQGVSANHNAEASRLIQPNLELFWVQRRSALDDDLVEVVDRDDAKGVYVIRFKPEVRPVLEGIIANVEADMIEAVGARQTSILRDLFRGTVVGHKHQVEAASSGVAIP
jgi:hypothetical protein